MDTIMRPYTFRARLHHAWDGDTIWLIIDRGEGWNSKGKYRLFGVDTPEIKGKGVTSEEKVYAGEAKVFVEDRLRDRELVVSTHRGKSKYDWMVEIWTERDNGQGTKIPGFCNGFTHLAQSIILNGHGVAYQGGTKLLWEERRLLQEDQRVKLKAGTL